MTLRGLDPGVRRTHRPAFPAGVSARGRHPRHPSRSRCRRVRRAPARASGPDRLKQLCEFLLVAAMLVELKSQRLLPGRETPTTTKRLDRLGGARPPAGPPAGVPGLRGGGRRVRALAEQAAALVPRVAGLDDYLRGARPRPPGRVTPEDLAQAYLRGSSRPPGAEGRPSHVTVDTVSVAEAVADLMARARGRPGHLVPLAGRGVHGPASRSSSASWPCSSCARWVGSRWGRDRHSGTCRSWVADGEFGSLAGVGAGVGAGRCDQWPGVGRDAGIEIDDYEG